MSRDVEEDPPPAEPADRDRRRLTGIVGTLAAACIGACFFLPWVGVDRSLGRKFREDVRAALERSDAPTGVRADFEHLADALADAGTLRGTDVILWLRTAHGYNEALDAEAGGASAGDATLQRGLALARLVFYVLLFCGFLIAAYFLLHRFRRVQSPVLILCVLTGSASLGVAAALDLVHAQVTETLGPVAENVRKGIGLELLLAGGAVLTLVGFFGVTTRNWLRVYLGSAAAGAGLVVLARHFLVKGF